MTDTPKMPALLLDFRLLLILFIAFRALMFLAYPPFLLESGERGIGVGGDRAYHYALSSLAEQGLYPFRDWWSEFPPVWYLTTTGVYVLLGKQASYDNWSLVLAALLLVVEAGNLSLIRRLGTHLHGLALGMTLAWLYALCIAPAVYLWWNFDALATFCLLWGVWLSLKAKPSASAVVFALGALVKFVPFLALGAVVRFWKPRQAASIIGIALASFTLAYVPLLALNSEFALISLTAQFNKPSYQTVWALLDGNYTTGNFGTIESHLSAEGMQDGVGERHPPLIPSWVRLGVAGGVGLWAFLRVRRMDALGMMAFIGLTFVVFYVQSQGWSPQWLTQLLPLLLLVFPNRDGVLTAVMLSVLAFVEYPFLFVRTGDTGGVFTPEHPFFGLWALVIVARTLILVGMGVAFYRKLRQAPNPELALTT